MLIIVPQIYYVEFLIYRSFKVFYDVNTCLNGAGGAITGFMGDILRLIFCFDGISRLILIYLPLIGYVAYLVYQKKKLKAVVISETDEESTDSETDEESTNSETDEESTDKVFDRELPKIHISSARIMCVSAMFYLIAVWGVYLSTAHANMYKFEYSYQSSVENIGLMTGLRLDIKNIVLGNDKEVSFEIPNDDLIVEAIANATQKAKKDVAYAGIDAVLLDETTDEILGENTYVPEVVEYDYNVLDIDFEALAETTSGVNHDLDLYVASLTPSHKNEYTGMFEGKNLILISAEAFSGEIVDPELTPTLYRLIHNGIYFEDYYQPAIAGTTGGEYSNLFGMLPAQGGKSMQIITDDNTFITMGNQLNRLGYYGKAYHNNTSTIYSRNITHNKLGYSDGFMGVGDGMEEYLTGTGFPKSDYEMMVGTFAEYVDKQPFNVYYMTVSGHGQYGRSINQMSHKNWERAENLPYSEQVRCYIANNLELEDALTYLVSALEEAGIADNTVICLSPDHFPYGLDYEASLGNMPYLSELYGYNVTNYLQRDHNSCIIWCGELEKKKPIVVSSPASSMDLLPTLCNLFGVEFDSRLYPGRDVLSDAEAIIFDGSYDWKTDLGTYYSASNTFVPVSEDIEIPDGYVERVKAIVRNKYAFCKGVLQSKYYSHVYEAIYGNN